MFEIKRFKKFINEDMSTMFKRMNSNKVNKDSNKIKMPNGNYCSNTVNLFRTEFIHSKTISVDVGNNKIFEIYKFESTGKDYDPIYYYFNEDIGKLRPLFIFVSAKKDDLDEYAETIVLTLFEYYKYDIFSKYDNYENDEDNKDFASEVDVKTFDDNVVLELNNSTFGDITLVMYDCFQDIAKYLYIEEIGGHSSSTNKYLYDEFGDDIINKSECQSYILDYFNDNYDVDDLIKAGIVSEEETEEEDFNERDYCSQYSEYKLDNMSESDYIDFIYRKEGWSYMESYFISDEKIADLKIKNDEDAFEYLDDVGKINFRSKTSENYEKIGDIYLYE